VANSGEINATFGVYKSVCCGAEIVISKGVVFPPCPKHPKLPAIWEPVESTLKNTQGNKTNGEPAA
jgi:hypothetical protein